MCSPALTYLRTKKKPSRVRMPCGRGVEGLVATNINHTARICKINSSKIGNIATHQTDPFSANNYVITMFTSPSIKDRKSDPRRQGENRKNEDLRSKIGRKRRSGTNRPSAAAPERLSRLLRSNKANVQEALRRAKSIYVLMGNTSCFKRTKWKRASSTATGFPSTRKPVSNPTSSPP